jgi:hypothetical protein
MSQSNHQPFRPSTNGRPFWRDDDPAPPSIVDEPPTIAKTTTGSRHVPYEDYVMRYANRQRNNIFLIVLGVVLGVGAAIYASGPLLIVAVAVALGMILAGGVAFLVLAGAHDSYRELSITRTENYFDPRPTPTAEVRPVVPDVDNDATIRRGRFSLPRSTWLNLFRAASDNDGKLARDKVVAARGLPRPLYHGEAWQVTLDELRRLGLIDGENCVTITGWAFRDMLLAPSPADGNTHIRSRIERTGTNERPRTASEVAS